MVERLFRAHYTDGFNLADPAVLDRLAADLGVIGPGMSDDDSGAAHVRSELAAVRREGVTGVPVFIVDGRALSGAQSQDVLLRALQRSA
jgi:predicted DsbA family dithiol-disulfide isomerase